MIRKLIDWLRGPRSDIGQRPAMISAAPGKPAPRRRSPDPRQEPEVRSGYNDEADALSVGLAFIRFHAQRPAPVSEAGRRTPDADLT